MQRAFTLIELLVVLVIIALLAAIIVPHAFRAIERSMVARVMEDSKTLETAAYAMYGDVGLWPGSNWGGGDCAEDILCNADLGEGFVFEGDDPDLTSRGTWNGPYVEKWPINPWKGTYRWDYNSADQNGDGIGREHVLWIDNSNGANKIPEQRRWDIDEKLDDGNLDTGRVQIWQPAKDYENGNLGYILIQGQ